MNSNAPKEMTEKQRVFFERGFEEGYGIARRNYEAFCVDITTKKRTRKNAGISAAIEVVKKMGV